jgi:NADH-quinone oxidoreductase subunit M
MTSGFQYTSTWQMIPSLPFALRFGVDGISIFFILLTNIFIYLSILSLNVNHEKLKDVLLHLLFLQWTVIASFLFLDILGFFVFFEMTLIPIYFLVLVWGSRERKVRASYLISIYTLLGSIFMFFNLLYLLSKTGTTDYQTLQGILFTVEDQKFLWLTFFISFAAKIPLFPLHIWLPEAHVEAPTIGSVLLAVLLLKLGTYGIIRFSLPLFPEGTLFFGPLASTFAVIGVIYTCLTAIRQIDLKKIIAYSSVGHMNVVLLGILSLTSEGLEGAIFQMLSHGVVSGALFFAVGSIYERYSVRSLKYFGGLAFFYPIFSLIFLIFSMANISFPLSSSFVGEFLILMGLFKQSFWSTFFASTSMVLSAVYTLWTYNRIFFGNVRNHFLISYADLNRKETLLFILLIIILFFMGIFSYLILDTFLLDCINLLTDYPQS